MDFKNTRISLARSPLDYSKVQPMVSAVMRNRKFQFRRAVSTGKKLLNIGCGPNTEDGFINLDYNWRKGVDICADLNKGIPLPSNYIEGIYSEHCFEHLPFILLKDVLKECYRIMRTGATIRLIVPDAEIYIDKYNKIRGGQEADFPYVKYNEIKSGEITAMMAINSMFREHGHLYAYDFETMGFLLKQSGFSEIQKKSFQHGSDPLLLIDTPSRAIESLYVEAIK